MKHGLLIALFLFTIVTSISAQIPRSENDRCHAYVVDVAMGLKLNKELEKATSDDEKAKIIEKYKSGETIFPFEADVNEETETTKHFAFPNSKLFITASVYYTDEMMDSETGPDSITLAIFVSPKKPDSAIGIENIGNAVADIAYNPLTSKVRVKHYKVIDGKKYIVGLECESKIRVPKEFKEK